MMSKIMTKTTTATVIPIMSMMLTPPGSFVCETKLIRPGIFLQLWVLLAVTRLWLAGQNRQYVALRHVLQGA